MEIAKKTIEMTIWDTAGQERFRHITNNLYKDASGIVLVYDKTDRKTFNAIDYWIEQIRENGETQVEIILLGNKSDMEGEVSKEEGEALGQKYKLTFLETSAKDGNNVVHAFKTLATQVIENKHWLEKQLANVKSKNGKVKLKKEEKKPGKRKCC